MRPFLRSALRSPLRGRPARLPEVDLGTPNTKRSVPGLLARAGVLALLVAGGSALAAGLEQQWQVSAGGTGDDGLFSLGQTSDGGYLLGGRSGSGVAGNKSSASSGNYDFWISRLDANGSELWERSFGGNQDDTLFSVQPTSAGGYMLGGRSGSGVSGSKTSASYGVFDFWLVEINSGGTKIGDKSFGGTGDDHLTTLQRTTDGGYILGGYSNSAVSGSKTSAKYGNDDYWVVKLDASGNQLWDRSFGGAAVDTLNSLQQTSDGGYILGGQSASGVGGSKTAAHYGGYDYWVVKLDASGNELWQRSFGGSAEDSLRSLQQTSDGGYILGGVSISGPGAGKSSTTRSYDMWVVKLNSSGNRVWDRSYGGNELEVLEEVRQTSDGGYVLGGFSNSGATGTKTSLPYGAGDFWLVKIDATGTQLWDRSFGGSGDEAISSLEITSDGGYVMGGHSNSPPSGSKTSVSYGHNDYWVVKIAPEYADGDGDGVPDSTDICRFGNDRVDPDRDGVPSACDDCPDDTLNDGDEDGLCASEDNCPTTWNEDQDDFDGDDEGDLCDTDWDGDGVDDGADLCIGFPDGTDADDDGIPDGPDAYGDACDICPDDFENDADADGACESDDNCEDVYNADQADTDGDALGNACDDDDDDDGVLDTFDAFPFDPSESADSDGDGTGDTTDTDDDGDEVADASDNCALLANADQADTDGDGDGDACDADDDNDGVSDDSDGCDDEDPGLYDANGDGCLDDTDLDGVPDDVDVCPLGSDLVDEDGDAVPDACDACLGDPLNDQDSDDLCTTEDLCPLDPLGADDEDGDSVCDTDDLCFDGDDLVDTDGDGYADDCDACPADAENDIDNDDVCGDLDVCLGDDTIDPDADGIPSACDTVCPLDPTNDVDMDSVCGLDDPCPVDAGDDSDLDGSCDSEDICQGEDDLLDTDGDGLPDCQDSCPLDLQNDGDNDGLCESDDNCEGVANSDQADADGDSIGNVCEQDSDADRVIDDTDNCPLVANAAQLDTDGDGQGDACDADSDGDGVANGSDSCTGTPVGTPALSTGCSVAQTCSPTATWRNHGAYVSCVTQGANALVRAGTITSAQKDALTSAAAESAVGRR